MINQPKSRKETKKSEYKTSNFFKSLPYALRGLKEIFQTESNVRYQVFVAAIVLVVSLVLKISKVELLVVLIAIFFVIFSEIVNTLVERTMDLYTTEYNEKVKIIKDMAAGAVLFSAACSVIVGIVVFLPKIIELIGNL